MPWGLAPVLRPRWASMVMFRATLLSIVLVLAAGPSASVLCKALCDPHVAAASGCHHQDDGNATQASGDASCQDAAPGATALLREDVRRSVSAEGIGAARPIASFQLVTRTSDVRSVFGAQPGTADQKRPLSTPLRI